MPKKEDSFVFSVESNFTISWFHVNQSQHKPVSSASACLKASIFSHFSLKRSSNSGISLCSNDFRDCKEWDPVLLPSDESELFACCWEFFFCHSKLKHVARDLLMRIQSTKILFLNPE